MADEQFGNLSKDELDGMRSAANEAADAAKTYREALREAGESSSTLTRGLLSQEAIALNLAKVTADSLKDSRAKVKLEERVNKLKGVGASLAEKEKELAKEAERSQSQIDKLKLRVASTSGKNLETAKAQLVQEEIRLRKLQTGLDVSRQAIADNEKLVEGYKKLVKEIDIVNSKTKFFDKLQEAISSIPGLGPALSGPFQQAAAAAKEAAEKGGGRFNTFLKGSIGLAKGLMKMFGPAAIFGAILKASNQASDLNKQLGMGMESSLAMRERFAEVAQESGSARFNTEKLVKANIDLNNQLGTSVEFSGQMLKDFVQMTEYMGLSAEASGKLAMLGKITGQESNEFAGNIASAVVSANKANGVFISTGKALEKVKNLSATTLLNLRRNPEAIAEAIVATEKLGMSFEQLRNTANSLLDFESSISNELEAELLTGKQINLERARAAALRGDDLALTQELARQVGTLSEYESMNVIQRESLAKAFGMNADAMADMLMKQELMNKLGAEANDLTSEQAEKINKLMKENKGMTAQEALLELQTQESATKKFEQAVAKLKNVFVDIVAYLEPVVQKFAGFIETIASSGISKMLLGGGMMVSLLLAIKNMAFPRGTMMNPMITRPMGGAGGMGGTGMGMGFTRGQRANMVRRYGSASAARGAMAMNRGMGIAAIGGIAGGMMMTSENENVQAAGGALTGAASGAMMGSMFGPVGMGIGAAVGGIYGFIQQRAKKEDERLAKEIEEIKERKARESDHYSMMHDRLTEIARKDVNVYMDTNDVGLGLVQGNPQLGN